MPQHGHEVCLQSPADVQVSRWLQTNPICILIHVTSATSPSMHMPGTRLTDVRDMKLSVRALL